MIEYPALLDCSTQKYYAVGQKLAFVVGRSESADLAVTDLSCSRSQFRILKSDGRYFVEQLSQTNPTYCNGSPVTRRAALSHLAVLKAGNCQFQFLETPPSASAVKKAEKPAPAASAQAGAAPGEELQTVMADDARAGRASLATTSFPVSGRMLIGREAHRVQIHLPHPQVSRLHAQIVVQDDKAKIVDLESANGTFVNGKRLRAPASLKPGDQIDIGPYALRFTGQMLQSHSRSDNVELIARNLKRVVTNRETGQPLALLDNITLVIRPREFVCLLGPSGSGKSTLLSALSGRTPATAGAVLLNGADLYAHFDALKQDMAVVPQKDILHDSLCVHDALWFTAKLRLPPDTSEMETQSCIDQILNTVGLTQRRSTLIRHLSGGQIKRASLANEILCKPSLLFLDEVTSGLDEQTDREMMDLFRSVADTGKTVVCITHSLANVERTCHLVVILTHGGMLAFIGKPGEALSYFGIERLGDVYERLATQPADYWQKRFETSPLFARYIDARLPAEVDDAMPAAPPAPREKEPARQRLRQTLLLTRRYWAIWQGDYLSLLAMLGQCVLVAVLLSMVFGNLTTLDNPVEHAQRSVNLFFLLAISSFWFGCNNAAKEIVKERVIYTRERDYNLHISCYYVSKFLLLAGFSGVQSFILFAFVRLSCSPPGAFLPQWLVLIALSMAGVTLGLAISSAAPTEEVAVTLIPMAIIPQIILSGVIAPLTGASKLLAQTLVTTYWGKWGLDSLLPADVADAIGLERGDLATAAAVLFMHIAIYLSVALALLAAQSRRKKSGPGLGRLSTKSLPVRAKAY